MADAKSKIQSLLSIAQITVNGPEPWDIQVKDESLYNRLLSAGSVGLGESYMDGWWWAKSLEQFFTRLVKSRIEEHISWNIPTLLLFLKSSFLNMQTLRRSKKVAREHYDIGNDLYMAFLDPYNQYTCGYFKNTEDLNTAQEQKLDLICRKLMLKPQDRVLDIGCGWGGFSKFASERHGCHVTGVSISEEQIRYAREFCKGLPVDIKYADYRNLSGKYDKILICGMIEHVGYKNYPVLMKKVHHLLKDDGLFLLHTIGSNKSNKATDPWFSKYIFPNSMVPSVKQLSGAFEGLFVMEDWHNFGAYYVNTLKAWMENFSTNWDQFKDQYGDRFYRMWEYYLMSSAGFFESRVGQLWQIVLSKEGITGGYPVVR